MNPRAYIIGGGLAGCTAAYLLNQRGYDCTIYDKDRVLGGLVRSDVLDGVVYEPHGSHIFHTDYDDVAKLVQGLIPTRRYEHSVVTMVQGEMITWPLQADELKTKLRIEVPENEITPQPGENFESFCVRLMGRAAYKLFVKDYTEKQWGRPATELSASFAPKRVQVRHDGDTRLFKDKHQFYPDAAAGGSYAQLLMRLSAGADAVVNTNMTLRSFLPRLSYVSSPTRLVVVTVPLDGFLEIPDPLEWRGLTFTHTVVEKPLVQSKMVVNWPGHAFPWIRTHEAKHASGQIGNRTVLTTEFAGGPGKYYPVPDREGRNVRRNEEFKQLIDRQLRDAGASHVLFLGRLSSYRYLDMDDVIKSVIDAVDTIPTR